MRQNLETLLFKFFHDNKLSFREIEELKNLFDKVTNSLHESREEEWAAYRIGRTSVPDMPDRNIEEDFWADVEHCIEKAIPGLISSAGKASLAKTIVNLAGVESKDYYLGIYPRFIAGTSLEAALCSMYSPLSNAQQTTNT